MLYHGLEIILATLEDDVVFVGRVSPSHALTVTEVKALRGAQIVAGSMVGTASSIPTVRVAYDLSPGTRETYA